MRALEAGAAEMTARREREKDLEQFAETWWNVVGTFLFGCTASAWIACTFINQPIKLPGFPDVQTYSLPLFCIPLVSLLLVALHGIVWIYRFGRGPVKGWQKLVPGLAVPRKSLGLLRLIPLFAFLVFPTASMIYFEGQMRGLSMQEGKGGLELKSSGPANYYLPARGTIRSGQTWWWVNPNPPSNESHGITAFPVVQPWLYSSMTYASVVFLLATSLCLLQRSRNPTPKGGKDDFLEAEV